MRNVDSMNRLLPQSPFKIAAIWLTLVHSLLLHIHISGHVNLQVMHCTKMETAMAASSVTRSGIGCTDALLASRVCYIVASSEMQCIASTHQ